MPEGARQGGVVFSVDGALHFLPATVAVTVLPVPELARVPGAPPELLGVAIVAGETMPVVSVGGGRGAMIVCSYLGERIGLAGVELVASGRFASAGPDRVELDGVHAPLFDIAAVIARLRAARWGV